MMKGQFCYRARPPAAELHTGNVCGNRATNWSLSALMTILGFLGVKPKWKGKKV